MKVFLLQHGWSRLYRGCICSVLGEKQPHSVVAPPMGICGGISFFVGCRVRKRWLSKCLKQATQARWGWIPEFLPSQQHPVQSASSLESLLQSKAEKTSKFHLIATSSCFKTKITFTRCAEKNRATSYTTQVRSFAKGINCDKGKPLLRSPDWRNWGKETVSPPRQVQFCHSSLRYATLFYYDFNTWSSNHTGAGCFPVTPV